jgi:soluble lytic murein transglycosylase
MSGRNGWRGPDERAVTTRFGSGDILLNRPVKIRRLVALGCALAGLIGTTAAYANSAAVDYFRLRADRSTVPTLLTQDERDFYKTLFSAIDRKDWNQVQTLFAQKPDGPLHQEALAEYFLRDGGPKTDPDKLATWLAGGVSLPQADQIERLATKRGLTAMPSLPGEQSFFKLPLLPKRTKPRPIDDRTMPSAVSNAIFERIKADDPIGARTLLDGIDASLSNEARAEWRQRVAWSYYIENDNTNAYTLAQLSAQGGSGTWVGESWWTAGLAAWRLGDCDDAAAAFKNSATTADNAELRAAGLYWQNRSLVRCRKPELASAVLRSAASLGDTLYGMLAAEQLGLKPPPEQTGADFSLTDWQSLRDVGNVRVAVELSEIGQDGLADEVLRHQAKIGDPTQYAPLTRLARDLGLPSTQLWMAYNAPMGGRPEPATRFPTPKWTPVGGWAVDPALVFAHTLQESVFRANVVSPAGARGLMQIMPSAAKDHAGTLGFAGNADDLNKPEVNLAFGQQHLQALRDSPGTQGLLPKVMAAYNCGLQPVMRWDSEIKAGGDPLLWIESLPFWETRGYVNVVLRNYWMYERQAGGPSESRMALAQGLWPTFPGLDGSKAVRMLADGRLIRGH